MVKFDMSEACPVSIPSGAANLVLCISEEAARAHRELFGLPEDAYATPAEGQPDGPAMSAESWLMGRIDDLSGPEGASGALHAVHLHLVVDWSALLSLALWTGGEPSADEIVSLLAAAGMAEGEARAVAAADRSGIFSRGCRESRLKMMRRLCRLVKRKVEGRARAPRLHVDCHVFAAESKRLVASNL